MSVKLAVIEVRDRSCSLIRTIDFSREADLPYHGNADLLLVEESLESHRICFLAG